MKLELEVIKRIKIGKCNHCFKLGIFKYDFVGRNSYNLTMLELGHTKVGGGHAIVCKKCLDEIREKHKGKANIVVNER